MQSAAPTLFAARRHKQEKRRIVGNAAPKSVNLDGYLREHAECEVYINQDEGAADSMDKAMQPEEAMKMILTEAGEDQFYSAHRGKPPSSTAMVRYRHAAMRDKVSSLVATPEHGLSPPPSFASSFARTLSRTLSSYSQPPPPTTAGAKHDGAEDGTQTPPPLDACADAPHWFSPTANRPSDADSAAAATTTTTTTTTKESPLVPPLRLSSHPVLPPLPPEVCSNYLSCSHRWVLGGREGGSVTVLCSRIAAAPVLL
jgi:hypothetical protein